MVAELGQRKHLMAHFTLAVLTGHLENSIDRIMTQRSGRVHREWTTLVIVADEMGMMSRRNYYFSPVDWILLPSKVMRRGDAKLDCKMCHVLKRSRFSGWRDPQDIGVTILSRSMV